MFKNIKYLYVVISTILIFVVTYMVLLKPLQKVEKRCEEENKEIENLMSRVLLQTYYTGNCTLGKESRIRAIGDEGTISPIKDVLIENQVVLYISSSYCNTCVDDAISKMKSFLEKYPRMNFLILASGFSLRELSLIKEDRDINFPIFSVSDDDSSFFKKIRSSNYPFFFTIDKGFNISNIFFPMKKSIILENRYFKQFISK